MVDQASAMAASQMTQQPAPSRWRSLVNAVAWVGLPAMAPWTAMAIAPAVPSIAFVGQVGA